MFTLRPLARPPQKNLIGSLSARHSDVVWWAQTPSLRLTIDSDVTEMAPISPPPLRMIRTRRKEDGLLLLLLLHALLRGKGAPACTQGNYDVSVQE